VSKNAEFHAAFESVEKLVQKCTKKNYLDAKLQELQRISWVVLGVCKTYI